VGITITISGDRLADVRGSLEDLMNGGFVSIDAPDYETQDTDAPQAPKKRGRPKKAEAPAATSVQNQVAAASPPPAPPAAPTTAPAASAPIPAATGAASPGDVPVSGPQIAPAAAGITYDQVFNQIKVFNDKHGMEKARAKLLEFGVGMVRQLKPEQYAEAMAKFAA
jgi:hypothetical protein